MHIRVYQRSNVWRLFKAFSTTLSWPNMSAARVLPCDPSSISFPDQQGLDAVPQISDAATESNLKKAADALRSDRLVAFPTETVYGLGGSALADSKAIPKIFATKGRPSDNPLIVHIASRRQLDGLVDPDWQGKLPKCYNALMERLWPGPLTLLFPTKPGQQVSAKVTCGLQTVGVRMPSHPVARALIAIANLPLAAPSANTSGRPSTTRATHVADDLQGKDEPAWILDGGNCEVGVESTVVSALPEEDSTSLEGKETLRVLRLGGISPEDLERCLSDAKLSQTVDVTMAGVHPNGNSTASSVNGINGHAGREANFIPSTPGMKYRHYSPNARVILLQPTSQPGARRLSDLLDTVMNEKVGFLHLEGSEMVKLVHSRQADVVDYSFGKRGDYEVQASRLFSALRDLDDQGVKVILVEAVKEEGLGRTVMERLRKSAGSSQNEIPVRMD